jgi:mono/diheme cytochrome c family protein
MRIVRVFALGAVVCLSLSAMAQKSSKPTGNVARGKYLVTQVGMCVDCHSPRDQKGQLIEEKALQGAPIMFNPAVEMPWAGTAPPIAGLDGWTDAQAIKFLTTGVDKDGKQPRPPMPPYRFNKSDAADVTAYLRSLNHAGSAAKKEAKAAPAAKQ